MSEEFFDVEDQFAKLSFFLNNFLLFIDKS